ncbi:hypothetical protein NEFER03_1014 [Nematocida sp. LUAm3]|nr:hypothetical protein NEFER03_1014 [Nematocida sp. LUAm3]KAI5175382.1 hypothetical protein NEFER02_1311 [Nematocida sp. LUAm2]KAI5177661.1 hypothetical protein NEFER01_0885 [Nematocida sp. LUAm1]
MQDRNMQDRNIQDRNIQDRNMPKQSMQKNTEVGVPKYVYTIPQMDTHVHTSSRMNRHVYPLQGYKIEKMLIKIPLLHKLLSKIPMRPSYFLTSCCIMMWSLKTCGVLGYSIFLFAVCTAGSNETTHDFVERVLLYQSLLWGASFITALPSFFFICKYLEKPKTSKIFLKYFFKMVNILFMCLLMGVVHFIISGNILIGYLNILYTLGIFPGIVVLNIFFFIYSIIFIPIIGIRSVVGWEKDENPPAKEYGLCWIFENTIKTAMLLITLAVIIFAISMIILVTCRYGSINILHDIYNEL